MDKPAVFASKYPPSERTFRGAISMRLASGGADVDDLVADFTALALDFDEYFPDDAPVEPSQVPAIVEEVVEEYQRVVTTMSPDALALMDALDATFRAGILFSYGDADEPADAMEYLEDACGAVEAEGGRLRGYLFALVGDLDELVLDQRLELQFGTFDADSAAVEELAEESVRLLTQAGLKAGWSGRLEDPIVIEPMVVDAPLVLADEEDDAGDGDHHHDGHHHDGHHHH